jgi:putative copper export protein
MAYVLRALRLVSIVVWVGGLIFFAFVEAPTAFRAMGTTRQFALLIGGSIAGINHVGQIAGMVFVLASLLLWKHSSPRTRKLLLVELAGVVLMLAAILYVQRSIVPAMERDRASVGGDITSVSADNPTRAHFDALHAESEKVEGTALFLGVAVVLLMAGEETRRSVPAVTR